MSFCVRVREKMLKLNPLIYIVFFFSYLTVLFIDSINIFEKVGFFGWVIFSHGLIVGFVFGMLIMRAAFMRSLRFRRLLLYVNSKEKENI